MTITAIIKALGGLGLAGIVVLIIAASVVAGLSIGIVGGLWSRVRGRELHARV